MANDSGINLEYPVLITGGNGSTLWQGCGFTMNVIRAIAIDAVVPGQALVHWFGTSGSVSAQWNASATSEPVQQVHKVKLSHSTTYNKLWAGVALTPAAAGTPVIIAGMGSLVPVKVVTLTNNALGAFLVATATAGSVNPTNTQATFPASGLGTVAQIAGTTGGVTDSGDAAIVIAHVNEIAQT